jgi:magnesium transporter
MLESTFDALDEVEASLDALAAGWTDGGRARVSRAMLGEAAARLATMRRWVTAEQALLVRLRVEIGALRALAEHEEPSFDRLVEQADRLLASIDAGANGMGMLLDLQLSERAYLVSVAATIFVPLTFVTGFFGMNFGWMIDRIDTPIAFWLLGLLPVAAAVVCGRLLVRRSLIGDGQRSSRIQPRQGSITS